MKEVDLSEPVRLWLESRGYEAYAEVPFLYSIPDWLGKHREDGTTIAVEMKRSLTRAVMHQVYTLNLACEFVYVAVGTRPRQKGIDRCTKHGIGVLSVVDGVVHVVAESVTRKNFPGKAWKRQLLERLKLCEPGGVAGKPTELESGPAQDCYERVQEYKRLHPKATWDEIFENVANHYASTRSMAGSMRAVVERRDWWEIRKKQREEKANDRFEGRFGQGP